MSQFALLRTRRFVPLFLTQFLGAFNDNVYRFALIIFITFTLAERTGIDGRTLVVLSGGIFILPFFLFSGLAGQLADKYEKSRLVRLIKLAEIGIMLLGAVGFWLGHTEFLLMVLFLMGLHSTFFGPLKYSILPQHLVEGELTGGNGLIQMGTYMAILLGGMCGGMLASVPGYGPLPIALGVVGIAFAGWASSRFIPVAAAATPSLKVNWNIWTATWSLLSHAADDRGRLTLVLSISWFWFLGATFLSLVPSYGKELLHANEQAVTLMNTAFTIGIGTGALLCERLSRGRIELGLVPLAALGLSWFAADVYVLGTPTLPAAELSIASFFQTPAAARVFFDLMMIGACGAVFIVPLNAALQARAAPTHRSRVIAALNVMNALFMVLSAVFSMLLFHFKLSIPGIFMIVAVMNLAVMGTAALALPEFTQRLRGLLQFRSAR